MRQVHAVQDQNLVKLRLVKDDEFELRKFDRVSVKNFVVDSSVEEFELFDLGDVLAEDNLSVLVVKVIENLLNVWVSIDRGEINGHVTVGNVSVVLKAFVLDDWLGGELMVIGIQFKGRDEVLVLNSFGVEVKNSSVDLVVVVRLFAEEVDSEPLDVGCFGGANNSQPTCILYDGILSSQVLDDIFDVGWDGVEVNDLVKIGLDGVLLDQSDGFGVEEFVGIDKDKPGIHGLLFLLDLSFNSGLLRSSGGSRC